MAANRYFWLNDNPSDLPTDPDTQILPGVSLDETPSQAASRKNANPALATLTHIPGPTGRKLRYSYDQSTKTILWEGNFPQGTTLRAHMESGQSLLLGNVDSQGLETDHDYVSGPISIESAAEGFTGQWAMGPRTNVAGSGIPAERMSVILKDSGGNILVKVTFTPRTISKLELFGQATTTGTSTGTGTPTSTGTATAPHVSSIGLASLVSYDTTHGGNLRIVGSGNGTYQMKIETVSGQALTLSNQDYQTPGSIPYNTLLGNGPSGNSQYPMDWTLWGVPQVAIKLTFDRNGVQDAITFTPQVGTNQVFTVVASGNGTSTGTGNGTGTSTPSPTSGGNSGGPITPFVVPQAQAVPQGYASRLENFYIQLDLDLKEGHESNNGLAGGIRRIVDKVSGRNMINLPVYRDGYKGEVRPPGTTDTGRGINECLYRYPVPFSYNGFYAQIGDNVNESGDDYMHSSRLVSFAASNNAFFTEIEPNQWGMPAQRMGDRFRKWLFLENNLIHAYYQSTFNRSGATGANNSQKFGALFQEAPCCYCNGSNYEIYYYNGNSPYTNDGLTKVILPDNLQMAPGPTFLTENWIATIDPNTGRGIGMMVPTPVSQIGQFDGKYGLADGSDFGSNYISYFPKMVLDKDYDWFHYNIFAVGTLSEIRQVAYDRWTRPANTPEYQFNVGGRQGWTYQDCDDDGSAQTRINWNVTANGDHAKIYSPAGAWKASSFKKLHMQVRYNGPAPQTLTLAWHRNRQKDSGFNGTQLDLDRYPDGVGYGPDYEVTAQANNNGQTQIITFDMTGKAEWKNIINEFHIKLGASGNRFSIDWVSANPTGPVTN